MVEVVSMDSPKETMDRRGHQVESHGTGAL
jgi:hypothetical protein